MYERQFINDFSTLGEVLREWLSGGKRIPAMDDAFAASERSNVLFTVHMQKYALGAICDKFLEYDSLRNFFEKYAGTLPYTGPCTERRYAGIIMAGNIPLVGFHDFLCVCACGLVPAVKLSHKDSFLLPAIASLLAGINPAYGEIAFFDDRVKFDAFVRANRVDAIIATGSDATSRAVGEKYPSVALLARGSRYSVAFLRGCESAEELEGLRNDIFLYYGLGCRNVSLLLVPEGYDFSFLVKILSDTAWISGDVSYLNIYRRNRAVALMEDIPFIDGGFFLLRENADGHVPAGVIGYRYYRDVYDAERFISSERDSLQKVYRSFGHAQLPEILEYADGKDTMAFLMGAL
ncbi:MAG: hypothetical protein LKI53_04450 [Bacteroidales bacterium]|jgi:hypothetical protein|nr:hypothetical protein [Bacteroidales bacterium]